MSMAKRFECTNTSIGSTDRIGWYISNSHKSHKWNKLFEFVNFNCWSIYLIENKMYVENKLRDMEIIKNIDIFNLYAGVQVKSV